MIEEKKEKVTLEDLTEEDKQKLLLEAQKEAKKELRQEEDEIIRKFQIRKMLIAWAIIGGFILIMLITENL